MNDSFIAVTCCLNEILRTRKRSTFTSAAQQTGHSYLVTVVSVAPVTITDGDLMVNAAYNQRHLCFRVNWSRNWVQFEESVNSLQCYARNQNKEISMHMVNEGRWRGRTVFECQLCGSAYADLETAERCEQYCHSHGRPLPTLTKKSLRKPAVQVDPIGTHSGLAPQSVTQQQRGSPWQGRAGRDHGRGK